MTGMNAYSELESVLFLSTHETPLGGRSSIDYYDALLGVDPLLYVFNTNAQFVHATPQPTDSHPTRNTAMIFFEDIARCAPLALSLETLQRLDQPIESILTLIESRGDVRTCQVISSALEAAVREVSYTNNFISTIVTGLREGAVSTISKSPITRQFVQRRRQQSGGSTHLPVILGELGPNYHPNLPEHTDRQERLARGLAASSPTKAHEHTFPPPLLPVDFPTGPITNFTFFESFMYRLRFALYGVRVRDVMEVIELCSVPDPVIPEMKHLPLSRAVHGIIVRAYTNLREERAPCISWLENLHERTRQVCERVSAKKVGRSAIMQKYLYDIPGGLIPRVYKPHGRLSRSAYDKRNELPR